MFISVLNQFDAQNLVKYWDKYTEMHGQENVQISDLCVWPSAVINYQNIYLCASSFDMNINLKERVFENVCVYVRTCIVRNDFLTEVTVKAKIYGM